MRVRGLVDGLGVGEGGGGGFGVGRTAGWVGFVGMDSSGGVVGGFVGVWAGRTMDVVWTGWKMG